MKCSVFAVRGREPGGAGGGLEPAPPLFDKGPIGHCKNMMVTLQK